MSSISQQTNAILKGANNSDEEEIKKLKEEIASLQKEQDELKNKRKELEIENTLLRSNLDIKNNETIEDLNNQIEALNKQIKALNNQIKALTEREETREKMFAQQSNKNKESQKEMKDAKEKQSDIRKSLEKSGIFGISYFWEEAANQTKKLKNSKIDFQKVTTAANTDEIKIENNETALSTTLDDEGYKIVKLFEEDYKSVSEANKEKIIRFFEDSKVGNYKKRALANDLIKAAEKNNETEVVEALENFKSQFKVSGIAKAAAGIIVTLVLVAGLTGGHFAAQSTKASTGGTGDSKPTDPPIVDVEDKEIVLDEAGKQDIKSALSKVFNYGVLKNGEVKKVLVTEDKKLYVVSSSSKNIDYLVEVELPENTDIDSLNSAAAIKKQLKTSGISYGKLKIDLASVNKEAAEELMYMEESIIALKNNVDFSETYVNIENKDGKYTVDAVCVGKDALTGKNLIANFDNVIGIEKSGKLTTDQILKILCANITDDWSGINFNGVISSENTFGGVVNSKITMESELTPENAIKYISSNGVDITL